MLSGLCSLFDFRGGPREQAPREENTRYEEGKVRAPHSTLLYQLVIFLVRVARTSRVCVDLSRGVKRTHRPGGLCTRTREAFRNEFTKWLRLENPTSNQ